MTSEPPDDPFSLHVNHPLTEELRANLVAKLRVLQVWVMLPEKGPELLELYRSCPVEDRDLVLIAERIAKLLDCDLPTAEAISDIQFRFLHPHYQQRFVRQIEEIQQQLGQR